MLKIFFKICRPILDIEDMDTSEKRAFCLLASPKQMSFLTISVESSFFKIQGTRLDAIVAPNKEIGPDLTILAWLLSQKIEICMQCH